MLNITTLFLPFKHTAMSFLTFNPQTFEKNPVSYDQWKIVDGKLVGPNEITNNGGYKDINRLLKCTTLHPKQVDFSYYLQILLKSKSIISKLTALTEILTKVIESENKEIIIQINRLTCIDHIYNNIVKIIFKKSYDQNIILKFSKFLSSLANYNAFCGDNKLDGIKLKLKFEIKPNELELFKDNLEKLVQVYITSNESNRVLGTKEINVNNCYHLFFVDLLNSVFLSQWFYNNRIYRRTGNFPIILELFHIIIKYCDFIRFGKIFQIAQHSALIGFNLAFQDKKNTTVYSNYFGKVLKLTNEDCLLRLNSSEIFWSNMMMIIDNDDIKPSLDTMKGIVSKYFQMLLPLLYEEVLDKLFIHMRQLLADNCMAMNRKTRSVKIEYLYQSIRFYSKQDLKLSPFIDALRAISKGPLLKKSIENIEVSIIPVYHSHHIKLQGNKRVKTPPKIKQSIHSMISHYNELDKKICKLNNHYNMIEMNVNLNEKKVLLKCNIFQASILLQFENVDTLTIEQLKPVCSMSSNRLNSIINQLVESGILKKNGNNISINESFPPEGTIRLDIIPHFKVMYKDL